MKQNPASEAKCPDDGEVLKREEVFRDKCAEKEILALECYCPNKSLGCLWTGLLAHLQDHDAGCPYTKVKCPYSNFGCNVVVLRHQLAKHVENDCVYKVVECPYCHVGYPGVKMREHFEDCGKFPVKCPHGCGESEILRENLPEHSTSCPHAPTRCRFNFMGCDFEGPRDSLDKHLRSSTPEHLILCCDYVEMITLRLQLNASQAMNERYNERLSLQNEALAINRQTLSTHQMRLTKVEENLSAQHTSIDETRQQLSLQNESLVLNKQALSTHQYKLNKMEENVEILHQNVEQLNQAPPRMHSAGQYYNQVQEIDRQQAAAAVLINSRESTTLGLNRADIIHRLDFQDERLAVLAEDMRRLNQAQLHPHYPASASAIESNHQFNHLEHSLALHEIQLADQDLKLQIMETTSYDGIFLWKIREFQRRFREAVEGKTISIYSPPFYTARLGYKLCARAYLNGDGMAKGKFLSLSIIIMQGEHDALLVWPFQEEITVKLLDEENTCHVLKTFQPDPNSSSFQRPASNMNIASGCPMFCPIRLLRSRCVYDDSILIKITVGTSRSGMPTDQKG